MDDDLTSVDGLLNFNYNSFVPFPLDQCTVSKENEESISSELSPSTGDQTSQAQFGGCQKEISSSGNPDSGVVTLPIVAPNGAQKPPYTYPELIEFAIEKNGPSTVSQIYDWMKKSFVYYRSIDDARWKPGIRHTLTTNPLFSKTCKDSKQRGWKWDVVPEDQRKRPVVTHWKRKKLAESESEAPAPRRRASTMGPRSIVPTTTCMSTMQSPRPTAVNAGDSGKDQGVFPGTAANTAHQNQGVVAIRGTAPQFTVVNTRQFFASGVEDTREWSEPVNRDNELPPRYSVNPELLDLSGLGQDHVSVMQWSIKSAGRLAEGHPAPVSPAQIAGEEEDSLDQLVDEILASASSSTPHISFDTVFNLPKQDGAGSSSRNMSPYTVLESGSTTDTSNEAMAPPLRYLFSTDPSIDSWPPLSTSLASPQAERGEESRSVAILSPSLWGSKISQDITQPVHQEQENQEDDFDYFVQLQLANDHSNFSL